MHQQELEQRVWRVAAIVTLLAIEMLAAAAAGYVAYKITTPLASRLSGFLAVEIKLVSGYIGSTVAYLLIHGAIFKDRRKGGKHGRNRDKRTRKPARGKSDADGARRGGKEGGGQALLDNIA